MLLTFIFIFQGLLICLVKTDVVGDRCSPTNNIRNGVCRLVTDCPSAIDFLKRRVRHPYSRCGFDGALEIVCCPSEGDKPRPPVERPTTEPTRTSKPRTSNRKAEEECEKIKEEVILPLVPHIIGGEDAGVGEYPHMAALGYESAEEEGNYEFRCGGSLISKQYVMTAAHCTEQRVRPTIVRVSVVNIAETGPRFNATTDYRVAQIIPHPDYNPPVKYNDLALIRLSGLVRYYSDNTSACCLATEEPNEQLTVTGWGTTHPTRSRLSDTLQKATVSLVGLATCSAQYPRSARLPEGLRDTQLCASGGGRSDACQGDSGGPLQSLGSDGRHRVLGVTSSGRGCAGLAPGIYTRISQYLDWIESIVWP